MDWYVTKLRLVRVVGSGKWPDALTARNANRYPLQFHFRPQLELATSKSKFKLQGGDTNIIGQASVLIYSINIHGQILKKMNYFIFYISGVFTVWFIDKFFSDERNYVSWSIVVSRWTLSLLSWISIIVFLAIQLSSAISKQITTKSKPPSWL